MCEPSQGYSMKKVFIRENFTAKLHRTQVHLQVLYFRVFSGLFSKELLMNGDRSQQLDENCTAKSPSFFAIC